MSIQTQRAKLLQIRLIMLQQKRRGGRINQAYIASLNKNLDLVLPTPRLPVNKPLLLGVCFGLYLSSSDQLAGYREIQMQLIVCGELLSSLTGWESHLGGLTHLGLGAVLNRSAMRCRE